MHLRRIRLAGKIQENIINFAIYLENSHVDSVFLDPVTEREIEVVRAETTENRQIMRLR